MAECPIVQADVTEVGSKLCGRHDDIVARFSMRPSPACLLGRCSLTSNTKRYKLDAISEANFIYFFYCLQHLNTPTTLYMCEDIRMNEPIETKWQNNWKIRTFCISYKVTQFKHTKCTLHFLNEWTKRNQMTNKIIRTAFLWTQNKLLLEVTWFKCTHQFYMNKWHYFITLLPNVSKLKYNNCVNVIILMHMEQMNNVNPI